MSFHRLTVKYFVRDPNAVDLTPLIGVFHRWIQEKRLEGLPIDVADYRHVFHGPGVILVGHEYDYALDMAEGRPGLQYVQKRRGAAALADALRGAFSAVLTGCRMLEEESGLKAPLTFATDEVQLTIPDRLRAPNTATTLEALKAQVIDCAGQLYGPAGLTIDRDDGDERHALTLRIKASQDEGVGVLLDRLAAVGA